MTLDAHAGEVQDRLLVRVLFLRQVALWPWWNFPRLCDGYWRMYWHDRPGAAITCRRRIIPIPPHQVMLIPAGVAFATSTTPGVHQLYATLDVLGCPPEMTSAPLLMPQDAILAAMVGELASSLPLDASPARSLSQIALAKSAFLRALALHVASNPDRDKAVTWSPDEGGLERCLRLMADDPGHPWTVPKLAARCGLSPSRLHHHFRVGLGQSPLRWLMQRRLMLAAERLAEGHPIPEIASALGFHDRQHFTRLFTRAFGIAPAAYRRRTPPNRNLEGPGP